MKPARIILLLVALIAGGLAFVLIMRGSDSQPVVADTEPVTQILPEATTQILVAKAGIGIGERLNADKVEWQAWPDSALRTEYVTIAAMPEAPAQLTDAVARFEFFPGEPIREQKLVRSDQGYLSAALDQGMRGVSVNVAAASGAGGFIVPNDHVDVVLTRNGPSGQTSETILSNVRVMAIGTRLGELGATGTPEGADPSTPVPTTFEGDTIATLELDQGQAETLINATLLGQLSLTLRSVVDFNDNSLASSANQTVRVIRYGKEQSVMSSASAAPTPVALSAPVAQPAAVSLPVLTPQSADAPAAAQ